MCQADAGNKDASCLLYLHKSESDECHGFSNRTGKRTEKSGPKHCQVHAGTSLGENVALISCV